MPEHSLQVAVQQWHCQAVKPRRLQLLSHWHRGAAEGLGVDTGVGGCPWVFLCSALSLIPLAKCGGEEDSVVGRGGCVPELWVLLMALVHLPAGGIEVLGAPGAAWGARGDPSTRR